MSTSQSERRARAAPVGWIRGRTRRWPSCALLVGLAASAAAGGCGSRGHVRTSARLETCRPAFAAGPARPCSHLRRLRPQSYDRVGVASWAGRERHGRFTASGEPFSMHALTAAHPTLPLPSYLELTNLDNGCMVIVRLNDRVASSGREVVVVSLRAAALLGLATAGHGDVRIRYLGPAAPTGDASYEEHFLQRFPDRSCLGPPPRWTWQSARPRFAAGPRYSYRAGAPGGFLDPTE